jgi:hypothetical protein
MMVNVGTDGSLTFVRGDDLIIPFEYMEDDGTTPIDLTGCTITSQVRTKPGGYIILEFDVELTDAESGKFTLSAPHAATSGIMKETGVWDVQLETAGGLIDTIVEPASVTIIRDVSIPLP